MSRPKGLVLTGLFSASFLIVGAWYFQLEASSKPTTRTYYIAADEVAWDYAPSGMDLVAGQPFSEDAKFWVESGPQRIGRVYKKAVYREYTDLTFTVRKQRAPEWEHLGILGPLVRAEVGDKIRIIFRNNASFPASVHPHGVFYDKDSEGAPYVDRTSAADKADDSVPTGETHTYVWLVPERAGPSGGDVSSVLWMYHSHTSEVKDVNAGLMGAMIISARGTTKADGTPKDVDREFIIEFASINENRSWYLAENIQTFTGDPESITIGEGPQGFREIPSFRSNFMQPMNGFVFGNLPGLTMRVGERVRWYLMASTNFEVHAPHWHGNTVDIQDMRTDVASLLTMGMIVADMVPDNPGTWLFHCHVGGHLEAGMQAVYTVEAPEVAAR